MHRLPTRVLLCLLPAMLVPAAGQSQQAAPATPPTSAPAVELSGILFPQFVYGGSRGSRSDNRFELERAYLTARARVADRTSIRVTADVFRPTATSSYTLRAKYAYAEYAYWTEGRGVMRADAQARLGMQPTVIIEVEEQLWPRWIAQVALERAGYFSSSDLGASTTLTFPGGAELFGMVSNGSGYATPENDRFKDWSARVSVAPFGTSGGLGLVVSPWVYKGARESSIVPDEGRKKDRAGVLVGFKAAAIAIGGQLATATNESESGTAANLATDDRKNRLLSVYTHLKPLVVLDAKGNTAWGIIARWDEIRSDDGYVPSGGAFPVQDGRFILVGLTHDLNNRVSWALDYQQQSPEGVSAPALDLRTYNLHAVVRF